eukprot:11462159-Ditylum_brightwellii.AAC.1
MLRLVPIPFFLWLLLLFQACEGPVQGSYPVADRYLLGTCLVHHYVASIQLQQPCFARHGQSHHRDAGETVPGDGAGAAAEDGKVKSAERYT